MNDLYDLYQQVILDHNRNPRNFGHLDGPTHRASGHNPLCGDKLSLYLVVDGDIVKEVRFEGSGCAISTASASLMTQSIKGKKVSEVEELFQGFHQLLTTGSTQEEIDLHKLEVFSGVSAYPARVKCATLPWHTLQAALQRKSDPISTE